MADPVSILQANAEVNSGENARLSSFVGAIAISDLVKTTLGPKGMDKILQSMSDQTGVLNVTNDGATILKSIHIDNPAAKVLVNMSKIQDNEVGDGTTSVVVLAGELLREAEKLIQQRIHPMTIIKGFRMACAKARQALEKSAEANDDDEEFKIKMGKVARTTLSSKLLNKDKDKFADLSVEAVLKLKGGTDLNFIQILKLPGGYLEQSYLDEGFLLEKKFGLGQKHRIENAKILIANTPMDSDKIKIFGTKVKVDSLDKVAEIEAQEKEKMKAKVEKICSFKPDVFINRQLIYNYPEQLFADRGVVSIEHADFDGIERLAKVVKAPILSTFDEENEEKRAQSLGYAKVIHEIMIGEQKFIQFKGLNPSGDEGEASTIVLRGASTHVLDEAERSLHDALAVLSQMSTERRTVLGGGCSEMLMANAVEELIRDAIPEGKELLAVEGFARALRSLPMTIADNGGFDSAELVADLRLKHHKGEITMGLDMEAGKVGCMKELGITESFKSKEHVVLAAAEAAEAILRVDYIVKAAPRQREPEY